MTKRHASVYAIALLCLLAAVVGCAGQAPTSTPAQPAQPPAQPSTPMPTETSLKPMRTPSPTPSPTPAIATIRVDPSIEHQTMDGIGAASYCFPYANDIGWQWDAVRYVFDELDIAYIRLAPWLGWWETANDNDDPYTINWEDFGTVHDIVNNHDVPYTQFLHERGIELAVGVWDFGAADWCDECVDWLANGKPRHIDPALYPEMGESISSYILHMRNNGVPIPVAEVQNEPDIEAGIKYSGPEALRDAGRILIEMLDHYGLEDVMLHAPNLHSPTDNVRWIEAWLEDEVLRERTVAVSYHTWWSEDRKSYDAIWQTAERYGKPVWATEVGYHEAGNAIMPQTWRTSWHYAKSHYRAIAWSHATRTYIWTLLGNDSAVGKDGERYPMFYVLKHFANYVPAGSVLLDSQADDNRLLSLVFRRPDGRYTVIVLNDNRAERTFTLTGDWRAVELIMTSENAYEVKGDPVEVNGDQGVTVTLPPLSLVSMILE
jgi:hypothetical protein